MNYTSNSNFRGISIVSDNNDILQNHWRVKTRNGQHRAIATSVDSGLYLHSIFNNELGYTYIRQIIPDVLQFSNKRIAMSVNFTSYSNINYDFYVSARFTEDDKTRITLLDSDTYQGQGNVVKTIEFDVPDLSDRQVNSNNGLSIAFRVIGKDKESELTIHSIEIIDDSVDTECNILCKVSKFFKSIYTKVSQWI